MSPIETTASDDPMLLDLARNPSVVAVVGLSPKPDRPSHGVARYLIEHGVQVYPVNPMFAGQEILGRHVYASLRDLPERMHIVDVFRRSDAIGPVIDEAIAVGADAVWLQLDIWDPDAVARARAAGLKVIVNHCLMVERRRIARTM